jgi:antitoxin (DNA-binding transcriptional repressor) of toxin-antitoxin stability system
MVNEAEAIPISVDEVQKHFAAYVRRIEAGQAFIITKGGRPLAEIRPLTTAEKPVRPFGLCAGQFVVPDDFDALLPEQILQDFEG